jgi:hypothetical protein
MDPVILAAFRALRAQVGALQAHIDALEALVLSSLPGPRPEPAPCAHEDREDDGSTLGHLRERCLRCGEVIEREIEAE